MAANNFTPDKCFEISDSEMLPLLQRLQVEVSDWRVCRHQCGGAIRVARDLGPGHTVWGVYTGGGGWGGGVRYLCLCLLITSITFLYRSFSILVVSVLFSLSFYLFTGRSEWSTVVSFHPTHVLLYSFYFFFFPLSLFLSLSLSLSSSLSTYISFFLF